MAVNRHNACTLCTNLRLSVSLIAVLAAQPVPGEHAGAARRDAAAAHVRAVPQELPLDPRPHRRRFQLLSQMRRKDKRRCMIYFKIVIYVMLVFLSLTVKSVQ